MLKTPRSDTGVSVRAPVVIHHAPCWFNPLGVNLKTCQELTSVPIRNTQGCCALKCTSSERLCKECLLKSGTPRVVVDHERGLCEEHLKSATDEYCGLSLIEQRRALPDLTTLSFLEARAQRDGDLAPSPVRTPRLPFAETKLDSLDLTSFVKAIDLLTVQQREVLSRVGAGMRNPQIAIAMNRSRRLVNVVVSHIYEALKLKRYSNTDRREILVRAWALWQQTH